MEADALAHNSEDLSVCGILIVDPNNPLRRKKLNAGQREELFHLIVKSGHITCGFPSLNQIKNRRKEQLAQLHESHKRLHNPHEYKVGLTHSLWLQKEQMLNQETV
jgi:nicotinate phosphoribosyltransferase